MLIDDDSSLDEYGRDSCASQYRKPVKAIKAVRLVNQLTSFATNIFGVMQARLESGLSQSISDRKGKTLAFPEVRGPFRHEQRITFVPIAEAVGTPLVSPVAKIDRLHRVMVYGNQNASAQRMDHGGASGKRDVPARLVEDRDIYAAGAAQCCGHFMHEPAIEEIFRLAARADRPWRFRGMADVKGDTGRLATGPRCGGGGQRRRCVGECQTEYCDRDVSVSVYQ